MNGTQASKISELSLRAIRQSDIDGMRDKLKIGDVITLSEQNPWNTERIYVKYRITEKYRHIFTAEKVKAKGKVVISMTYTKYMIEGKNAYARFYGLA